MLETPRGRVRARESGVAPPSAVNTPGVRRQTEPVRHIRILVLESSDCHFPACIRSSRLFYRRRLFALSSSTSASLGQPPSPGEHPFPSSDSWTFNYFFTIKRSRRLLPPTQTHTYTYTCTYAILAYTYTICIYTYIYNMYRYMHIHVHVCLSKDCTEADSTSTARTHTPIRLSRRSSFVTAITYR